MKYLNKPIGVLVLYMAITVMIGCQENRDIEVNETLNDSQVTQSEDIMISPRIPDQFADMARAAEEGNERAQFNMGVLFDVGQYINENDSMAFSWYKKAADQGFAPAQMSVAEMYDDGLGVSEDNAEAEKYYLMAADQGILEAQMRLGVHYQGHGDLNVQQDKSAKWFLEAAKQNHPPGMTRIGAKYADGNGVERDFIKAYAWTYLASERDQAEAEGNLKKITAVLDQTSIDKAIEIAKKCEAAAFQNCEGLF